MSLYIMYVGRLCASWCTICTIPWLTTCRISLGIDLPQASIGYGEVRPSIWTASVILVSVRQIGVLEVHFDFVVHLRVDVFAESASDNADNAKG